MSEKNAILSQQLPHTIETLEADFKAIGLKEGMVVIVHSSLSSLGWVSGGAVAVVHALMNVITEKGTLIMPTHSGELSEPKQWENPPVPENWWQIIRDTMPAFDPRVTPTREMGKIVECFRTFEGVKRSHHPQVSFAAWGRHATEITKKHQLAYGLGQQSPLQKIYDLDGHVLLLGVGHGNNTSLHLSEYHAGTRPVASFGAPIRDEHGKRMWQEFEDFELDADQFEEIGKLFEAKYPVLIKKVGKGTAKLMKQKALVDFGARWLQNENA